MAFCVRCKVHAEFDQILCGECSDEMYETGRKEVAHEIIETIEKYKPTFKRDSHVVTSGVVSWERIVAIIGHSDGLIDKIKEKYGVKIWEFM